MTASVKLFSSSMVLTEVTTEKGRVPEASKRGSSLWRLAGSLSLARAAMEESPLPNAETNRFIFSLLFCCWGFFFFFFFWLPLGCVSVCQHSHDWVFIRLSSGSGPCKRSDRCILSIRAVVQFAAFRICTTCTWWREWRRGGQESIDSLAGGKLEIQLTMHLSLFLSVLFRAHVRKTAEMGWRRDVLIFLNHRGTSFERNGFFFFSSFCKVVVYCSLWFSAFFHHHLWPVRT
jgi:hypothetical protein